MKRRLELVPQLIAENKTEFFSWGIFVLLFLCTWIFVFITRIGITPDKAYWNEAGVPILGFQVVISLIVGFSLGIFLSLFSNDKHISDRKNKTYKYRNTIRDLDIGCWDMACGTAGTKFQCTAAIPANL